MKVPVSELLPLVEKPSRYLGLEVNTVHKPEGEVLLRAALVFPDLYEVGMAHLGTQILYGLGNELDGVQVERVFLPGRDMLELLARRGLPLFTLESRTPVSGCQLVGFTLQSELTYTNILAVLQASGIPLLARDRSDEDPLVVGGGPCAFNPEPLWEFFDLFYLGDGEEGWTAMLATLREAHGGGAGRRGRMDALKNLDGIYDPTDFVPGYDEDGSLREIEAVGGKDAASPCTVQSLDYSLPPSSFPVPFLAPVHDRVNIEVTRGCTRGCRFCHAGMVYRPVRQRSAASVLRMADEALGVTGYGDLAMTSLSIGDYGPLDEVLEALMDRYGDSRVAVSLPSMRIGGLTPEVARQIRRVRRTGFTIAPEAGTERLRRVVNKDFTDEEILKTARWVFQHGWEAVKLYFMIGLPTETDADLEGIVGLVRRMAEDAPPRGKVTVNVSPFVPKAHTPFQWAPQPPEPELRRRLQFLQDRLKGKKVQVRWSRTDQALLEAALARGDRRVSKVILQAWRGGALMDGWDEHFDWKIWEGAFDRSGLEPAWYASRARGEDELFPWEHISCGVTKPFLLSEYRKGLRGEATPDCREAGCLGCGVCTPAQMEELPPMREGEPSSGEELEDGHAPLEGDVVARRIRAVFKKVGDLRFLGHLETVKVFERACRRAKVPLAFSGGFSPKPKISFALSLPTGAEGLAEWVDLELSQSMGADFVRDAVNAHLPEGLHIVEAWKAPVDGAALNGRVRGMEYEAALPEPVHDLAGKAASFVRRASIPVVRSRKGRERTVDLKEYLIRLEADDSRTLRFSLALKGEEGSARPGEVLQALLGMDENRLSAVRLTRTRLTFALEAERGGGRQGLARVWD
ncbi:MAG: TIGR03960 family B12-binding radical SAM protein [bacterium]|nr:MAG: TIGR03960 family B12-binding radical SAM protein [bacterium]